MRKSVIALIILSLLLTLCGCGVLPSASEKTSGQPTEDGVHIVTSFYPIYIMLLNITADIDGVTVSNLTRNETGCLHDYQLSPGDMQKLQGADLLVINGAGMEAFMDKIIAQYPHIPVVEATQGLDLIVHEGEINPHLWVSPEGAKQEVENIVRQLTALDPQHSDAYARNGLAYVEKISQLQAEMHQLLDNAPKRNIATFHDAFAYFAREFDLQVVAVVEREPGSEPSAGELAQIITQIKNKKVAAVFAEPQYPEAVAQTIARESGVAVYALEPAVSGPEDKDAYLRIMRQNLEVLREALY
ncbi:MAG: metal ABC transporter substrate-binding protein [Syntrophomonadaceae bacterium]